MPAPQEKIETKKKLKAPPLFQVIYLNDNSTTADFVVESLVSHFSYSTDTAVALTDEIHTSGSATVAIMPYEIAEQKGIEVTVSARSQGFPLQIKLEPDQVD